MAIPAGTYRLGPADGTLSVRTGRTGAAAMAGHNLLFQVTAWEAVLTVTDDAAASIVVTADGGSLQVIEGTGGMKALGEDDRVEIVRTVDEEVLKRAPITFRSRSVVPAPDGTVIAVEGELTLLDTTGPIAFSVTVADGTVAASVVVRQTDWKIKPYSTLFGALKVVDEVEVGLEARLPQRTVR